MKTQSLRYFCSLVDFWRRILGQCFVLLSILTILPHAVPTKASAQEIGHQFIIGPATLLAAKKIAIHETNNSTPRLIILNSQSAKFKSVQTWSLKNIISGLNQSASLKSKLSSEYRIQFFDTENPNLSSLLLDVPLSKEILGNDYEIKVLELKDMLRSDCGSSNEAAFPQVLFLWKGYLHNNPNGIILRAKLKDIEEFSQFEKSSSARQIDMVNNYPIKRELHDNLKVSETASDLSKHKTIRISKSFAQAIVLEAQNQLHLIEELNARFTKAMLLDDKTELDFLRRQIREYYGGAALNELEASSKKTKSKKASNLDDAAI